MDKKILHIDEILSLFAQEAPFQLQENYDNSGLIVGDRRWQTDSALLSVDVTEDVVDEAIRLNTKLIVAHHPIIFKGLKKLTPDDAVSRVVMKAIRHDIAIIAVHTNLDNSFSGTNFILSKKLGLNGLTILDPKEEILKKLVVFVPTAHLTEVRQAIFTAGGGHIGQYDSCSFSTPGKGSFRAGENANPFVGEIGNLHEEEEQRLEVIVPSFRLNAVINAMLKAHPYEEVAYDLIPLDNRFDRAGSGMIGSLPEAMDEHDFLEMIAVRCDIPVLRHTHLNGKKIKKVAVCGGSGAFLLGAAKAAGADAFVTADLKYHDFHDADNKLLFVDAGHYETEQFTKEWMADKIKKKNPNFAVRFSEVNTNPISYFLKS
ncbi:MAG: Nif3-like dinuclear metal center hexameric protein [Bacteroidales bacterium]|nr:Nif3-like dinuclear metal center hexameric protein [Bacteroidales bacterium]